MSENQIVINLSDDSGLQFPNKDNVGLIEVLNKDRIMISLSKNAMIGLGYHLIKLANRNYENGYHIHVDACERDYLSQVLGFFSHPDSAELIICCSDFDSINSYIK
ncbi:hypothetical protein A8990_11973 [Paenibacillus taihuensis]|uniref:Uncharacterized protein n=1 Tax=Paenibacillus taihuensis TaxID=1156355 RepID=A0A3D9RMV8_9BACL|nr:hypothetical protein [Paenibacillus taihuensis]REE81239.1 hypothetical protein A8990_11973 [Paenibacillus taihuensis]